MGRGRFLCIQIMVAFGWFVVLRRGLGVFERTPGDSLTLAGNRFIGPSFWLLQPRLSVSVIISVSPTPPPRKELAILDAVKLLSLILI